ncbi:MAG: mechanosensitive ion channel family protein [Rikenellaceae bacterium]
MKKLIFAAIAALALWSCASQSNKEVATQSGEVVSINHLVGERRVGRVDRGASIERLYKLYGENYVKRLRSPQFSRDSSEVATYYIYNDQNILQMIANTELSQGEELVKLLVLKDPRFTTPKGITVESSVEQLRAAYPDAVVVQADGRLFVFISSLDLYLRVNECDVRGYNPDFEADLPLDSLVSTARFENMSVSWNSHSSNLLAPQFWHDLLSRILKWLLFKLPVILFITLLFVLARRLLTFLIKNVNAVVRRRVEEDESLDASEAVKRVDTITGIVHGLLNIILWSIFVLIMLSKFNINIAPILASAGILGLAVGFGAQELVRDFISGFFILLEDQIRTGDMAIINDTTGIVEKIELRTVTLRDPSGVVHIFQNGKINSLSNMTKEWSAIILEIGVAYKENIDRVMEIMKEVGDELRAGKEGQNMIADIEIWGLDAFADSAITIKMLIKTRPMKQWRVKREYQRLLKIRFDAEGVEIPFPHITFYTGEQTKALPITMENPKEE